ncbi:NlpC/P60 family protein [Robiginitalea sp.]|jgi:cell wall-associated NlpC family hydrolase|uniref:C40 family peptidase n=1 Tax=Robiginitalea sp. TaxID=1902411 RepID=UPI003C756138
MEYGICPLSMVPVHQSADDTSGWITQLLYGEVFKIPETRKHWSRIRTPSDQCEGWVRNPQIFRLDPSEYEALCTPEGIRIASDLISHICTQEGLLMPIPVGSSVHTTTALSHTHEGSVFLPESGKDSLIDTALIYLNSPEVKGGRSPFGIDADGLSQMVYRTVGVMLNRKAPEQASQGSPLSFIEESEPGDLAFFDGPDGVINHVGLIMRDNYIIHCDGKVRIDRLDHTGIFNTEKRTYTHPLRVIVKVL